MKTVCRFCDYSKETPLSKDILRAMEDIPQEDLVIWIKRLVKTLGLKDYNSVKIHMGMKHKEETYPGIWPRSEYSDEENKLIDKIQALRA